MFAQHYFPDFMIIGAQKAGTSTLHSLLSQHPQLSGSTPKELHYFDKSPENRKSLEWYKSHFKKNIFERKKLFFETTPNYIYHKAISSELYKLKSDLKFIVMMRNPVTRCFSAWNMYKDLFEEYKKGLPLKVDKDGSIYQHLFKDRQEFPKFEECIKIELELMLGNNIPEPALMRRGLYYEQLRNFFVFFDKSNFFFIETNDFRTSKNQYLNDIASFLNIASFDLNKLNLQDKNVRSYSRQMASETKTFMTKFYQEPNQKLFQLLNRQFNW